MGLGGRDGPAMGSTGVGAWGTSIPFSMWRGVRRSVVRRCRCWGELQSGLQIPSVDEGNGPIWGGVTGCARSVVELDVDVVVVESLVDRLARRLWRVFAATSRDAVVSTSSSGSA